MSRLTAFFSAVLLPLIFAGASAALPGEAAPATPRPGSPAAATLARIAGLAGDWAGTAEWSGARTGSYALKARYYTTGYGSAVVEDLISEGVPSMTSVYHLDGSDLRMTHYCGTRNQPRLKASKIDVAEGAIDFTFVDATNLDSPDAPHVTGLELRFGDGDHFTMTFLFEGGGKSSRERISLQRVRLKA
ncbi:MAG: hypothetical protein M3S32_08075 [Acidobacteriota bacterium]|nr:hypothetical protein [Acidobacteriota bacterium]